MSSTPERRRSKRRNILDTFSLFVVVPQKGVHRLAIRDISDLGIGFALDIEGEEPDAFPLKSGTKLEIQLFLNQSLYLPLTLEVKRIEEHGSVRHIGGEFIERNSARYKALVSFVEMLDRVSEAARINPTT